MCDPENVSRQEGTFETVSPRHALPWRHGPLKGTGVLHHSTHSEQPSHTKNEGTSSPNALSRRRNTHPPRVLSGGVFPARFQSRMLHPQPLRMGPCTHSRPQPGAPPPRDPRNRRCHSKPPGGAFQPPSSPARRVPRSGRRVFHPPASTPEWNVPVSPQRVSTTLRLLDGTTGPQQGGQAGPFRENEGTRGPEPLPDAAPLSAAQVTSEVTVPPSALSASSGTSSSIATRADQLASGRPEVTTQAAAAAAEQQPPPAGGWREGAEPRDQGEGQGRGQSLRHRAPRPQPIGARGRGLSAAGPGVPPAPPCAHGVEEQRHSSQHCNSTNIIHEIGIFTTNTLLIIIL